MKRLLVFLVLAGCATTPPPPTDGQLAMWAYWASLCGEPNANYDNIEILLRTDAVLRGCVTTHAVRADIAYRAGQQYRPNVIEASGQVLQDGSRSQTSTRCSTRPDYSGGLRTTCD